MTRTLALLVAAIALLQALALIALGHDCSSARDCEQTAGYNAVVAVAGGIVAIVAGVLGTALGGAGGAAAGGVAATAPVDETEPSIDGTTTGWPAEPTTPLPEEPTSEGEPPLGGEPTPFEEPTTTPGGPDDTKPAGDKPEGPEKKDEPKDFGEETIENVSERAEQVKDGVKQVGEKIDELPISDEDKKALKEKLKLDKISDVAGDVKDAADKVDEYVKALNENLRQTEKMKLTGDSQSFLGWWRVTFKAVGELTEKFVDGLTSPVTKLLGEKYGDKAQDLIHDAVPIKEFGDELSKLPTSAAQHVVNASQRNQDQTGNEDVLDGLYPRDWDKAPKQ